MKRYLISLVLALVLVLAPHGAVFAATSQDVTVSAVPLIISLDLDVDNWPINGLTTGDNVTRKDTTYYSNPAGDTTPPTNPVAAGATECRFMFTNSSSVSINITMEFPDFTTGDAITNINTGYANNAASSFGISGYVAETAWPGDAVPFEDPISGSPGVFISDLAAAGEKYWSMAIKMQSDDFVLPATMYTTVTATASEYGF